MSGKLRLHTMIDAGRVQAALHEAGYPHVRCRIDDNGYVAVRHEIEGEDVAVPGFALWRAFAIAGIAVCCWQCFKAGAGLDCDHPIDVLRTTEDQT